MEYLISHPEMSQQNSWESTGLRKALMSSGAYTTYRVIKALDVNKCPQNTVNTMPREQRILLITAAEKQSFLVGQIRIESAVATIPAFFSSWGNKNQKWHSGYFQGYNNKLQLCFQHLLSTPIFSTESSSPGDFLDSTSPMQI